MLAGACTAGTYFSFRSLFANPTVLCAPRRADARATTFILRVYTCTATSRLAGAGPTDPFRARLAYIARSYSKEERQRDDLPTANRDGKAGTAFVEGNMLRQCAPSPPASDSRVVARAGSSPVQCSPLPPGR